MTRTSHRSARRPLDVVAVPTTGTPRSAASAGIVVEHGHRQVRAVGVAQHGRDGLLAPVAGTEHHHPFGVAVVRAQSAVEEDPPAIPEDGHRHEGDESTGEAGTDRDGMTERESIDQNHQGGTTTTVRPNAATSSMVP